MLGYWNDPQAGADALACGVLRTGDIGTVTPDGEVFVHDRRKLVIVRGGANVYPAEVERTIRTVPGVIAAAVVGLPDARLGARVAAAVHTTEVARPDVTALAERCRAELSRYKVPETWHLTTTPLPRNAMGKIDRRRVAELLTAASVSNAYKDY
jgi:acyl-CoA synthetase (AMP-forming)/AMP-acid ligase II